MVPVCKGNGMRKQKTRIEHFCRATLAVAILSGLVPLQVWAQSTPTLDARVAFNIPAGGLAAALDQFSTQTGIQTLTQPDQLAGKQVSALSGQMTWREALERLLRGTGLEYRQVNATTVVVRPASQTPKSGAGAAGARSPSGAGASEKPVANLQSVTVTGTRIRGGTTPSPVITIGSENIQEEGFTDLGEVIRSVPQNFTGGQNPSVIPFTISGAGDQNQNITGGSSLNLRGLGPDATLTLLDGRRMAYGGYTQAVDISAIPVEAVDRIEIVADGASAIYGSDAVGGVGNVILKRDFEGVTIGALYGTATEGGLDTREYTATAGTTWSTGSLLATYKDSSSDPIYASQRDYTDFLTGRYTLYPGSDLRSGLVSVYQSMGDIAQLHLDAFRTKRSQTYGIEDNTVNAMVLARPDTTTTLISPGVDFSLPGDWTLSFNAVWSKSDHIQFQQYQDLDTHQTFFTIKSCYCNKLGMYEAGAEGPLFTLSGGDARLAVGAGYRKNEYAEPDYISGSPGTQGEDRSRFAYGELSLPFFGPESGIAGVRRLEVTVAARREYDASFGGVTTPKLGIIYGPNADFTLKASWGKSFKAPTLDQRYYMHWSLVDPASDYGGSDAGGATVVAVGGGNPDLGPERATTWTTSLEFHPEAVPNLQAELSWFDIDYRDRVVQPITNSFEALVNPIYSQFVVRSPTQQQLADAIASTDAFYNYTHGPYDPSKVVALIYSQYVNIARQKIQGLDWSGSYRIDVDSGALTIRGSASWLDSTQRTTPSESPFDLAGTVYNPPRVTARLGSVWSQGGLIASVFANYKSGIRDLVQGNRIASYTTIDATARYAPALRGWLLSGMEFALSAQNLFDRKPPLHTINTIYLIPPYDATNYSPVGRYLSFSVTKHW